MGAIDVSVGHDDDFPVASAREIEGSARSGADNLDDGGTLLVVEHVLDGSLLGIEDFASNRQQRLMIAVPGKLCGAQRRIALHDEEFSAFHVLGATVHQLGGQSGGLESSFSALGLFVSPGGETSLHFRNDLLLEERTRCLIVSFARRELLGKALGNNRMHNGLDARSAEHLFGLAFKLWFRHPHGNNRGQAGDDVVLLDLVFADLEAARILVNLSTDGLDEPRIEARLVGATLRGLDDVHKTFRDRVVTGAPLDHDIHVHIPCDISGFQAPLGVQHGNCLVELARARKMPRANDRLVGGQKLEKVPETTLGRVGNNRLLRAGAVMNLDCQPWDQKGCLPGSLGEFRRGKGRRLAKDLRVWPKTDPCSGHTLRDFSEAGKFAVVHERLER